MKEIGGPGWIGGDPPKDSMECLADIMTKRVAVVGMDDNLHEVRRIFEQARFHHLMVVEHGELKGVLSDRDLLKHMSPHVGTAAEGRRDLLTLDRKVHQVMTREPVSARPDMPVFEAARVLVDANISCLPVVSDEGAVVGIVTWKDLLCWLHKRGS